MICLPEQEKKLVDSLKAVVNNINSEYGSQVNA